MKILPFYTSTAMRDAERVSTWDALLCPVYKFLPFQIQREHLSGTYVTEVTLVDCNANETDVFDYFFGSEMLLTGWVSNGLNTFIQIALTPTILTAIESDSDNAWCFSTEFALATGESIAVDYNLTLNANDLPTMLLADNTNTDIWSKSVECAAGGDVIYLTATGNSAGNVRLLIENLVGDDTSFACTFTDIARTTLDLVEKTSYDFIAYNGDPLGTTLPYGVYYLRIADGNTTWYSEWFSVENIQPSIMTGYSGDSYDTFDTSGTSVLTGINLAGTASADSNTFDVFTGEKLIYTCDLILNSGSHPEVILIYGAIGASNTATLLDGLNEVELTATRSATVELRTRSTNANNFILGSVSLRRKAGEYVHLEYTNARDFNNGDKSIYYVGGWTQQAYLRSYENLPSHESIEVGGIKNGVFEVEKLVRKYTRSVVSSESRAMYDALSLMKNHTTIKILDEVGIEHTPNVGNVDVNIDWNTFDTGSLRIAWNEVGEVWTNSMDNIV